MANHLGALADDVPKVSIKDSVLVSFTNVASDLVPRVGDESESPQFVDIKKPHDVVDIQFIDSANPFVGDAVDVDDSGECRVFSVSGKFSREDQKTTNADMYSLRNQESSNHPQNLSRGLGIVIEFRGIDENDPSFIKSELVRELDSSPG